MKKFLQILGLFSVVLFMSFAASDFFSSMTKVDYVEGSKTLKFTTKMNTEHVSNAININPNTASFEAEVKRYVNNRFTAVVNGSPVRLTFTGSQVNGESVWVYFEAAGISSINTMKISNAILLETYPKQVNIVNIAYKGNQKTMTFQRGRETNEVTF